MPLPGKTPVLQFRIIGTPARVDELTGTITTAVGRVLGPGTTCRRSTHPASRAGHIRRYITTTRRTSPMTTPLDLPATGRPKALYRIPEAMRLLSMSRTVIYEQLRAGRLRSVRQGRTRLIPAAAITDYVALLESEATRRAA